MVFGVLGKDSEHNGAEFNPRWRQGLSLISKNVSSHSSVSRRSTYKYGSLVRILSIKIRRVKDPTCSQRCSVAKLQYEQT